MTSVPATAAAPLVVSSYDALASALKLYLRHAGLLLGASVVLQVLQVAATFLILSQVGPQELAATAPIDAFAAALTTAVCAMVLVHLRAHGRAPSPRALLVRAGELAVPLVLAGAVLTALITAAAAFAPLLGTIVACLLAAVMPIIVTQPGSVFAAFRRSVLLTKRHFGSVFAVMFIQGLVVIGIPYLTDALAGDQLEDWLLVYSAAVAITLPWTSMAIAVLAEDLEAAQPLANAS